MKKVVIFLMTLGLAACLAGQLFANGQAGSTAGSGDRTAALAEIGFNATGYPIVSKPYSFTGLVSRSPMHGAFTEMEPLHRMERETGVKVEWIEVPGNGFNEQKNLMLASNDLPDVFFHGMGGPEQLRYGPTGTIVPLEGLISQYAPRIKSLLDGRPDVRRAVVTPDGHQYVLPVLDELAQRYSIDNAYINKTWLDKLGLKVPATLDEFANVLRAFRDRDPNGNGKKDEIPFSFATTFGSQFHIFSMYGAFGQLDNPNHVIVKDKKVLFTANTPQWRAATEYFRGLYAEGLIDQEAFTHDRGRYFGKGMEPDVLYGVFVGWYDENEVGTARAEENYVALPPLMGVDGKQRWLKWIDQTLERHHFAITSKMKHPEVAIRWADLCYEPEHSWELKYGPFGIVLEKQGDKILQITPPQGQTVDEFRYKHCPAVHMPLAISETEYNRLVLPSNMARKQERHLMYSQFFPADDEVFPNVYFTAEEEQELPTLRTDVTSFVNEMKAKFIIGAEPLDNNSWNNYVQTLNRAGVDRYLTIYQAALDRYNR